MAVTIITIRAEDDEDDVAVSRELSGVEVVLRVRWFARLARWWLETYTADGATLLDASPLAVGSGSIWSSVNDPRLPAGVLQADGPDPHVKSDLGTRLLLVFVPLADLEAA